MAPRLFVCLFVLFLRGGLWDLDNISSFFCAYLKLLELRMNFGVAVVEMWEGLALWWKGIGGFFSGEDVRMLCENEGGWEDG